MNTKWLAALAVLCAGPATAQVVIAAPPPDFDAMSDAELRERVTTVLNTGFFNACNNEMPLFSELVRRNPTHAGYRSAALFAEAVCAREHGRLEEALSLLKQSERAQTVPLQNNFGLDLAIRMSDGAEALSRLRKIAAAGRIRYLGADFLFAGIRTVTAAGLEDELGKLAYELTDSREFAQFDLDVRRTLAVRGLRHAVKAGDLSKLDELLEHIPNPVTYVSMLADRDYEAAWPAIEERSGDNLKTVADGYVRLTADRLAEKPEDRDRLSSYAHALHFAGRFQEAVDVARNWRAERNDLSGLEEGDAWSINIEAYALDALGRRDEADAVFDQLAKLPAEDHPWVVNFVINRASRLVGQERWEEGVAATDLARSVADEYGSTYAKLIIARDRACALQRLGRTDEVAREAAFLVEQFDEYPPLAVTGLLCLGRQAEAERLLAAALTKEVSRRSVLNEMQDPRFELFHTPSALTPVRDLVLANETLRAEVLKDVRILPDRFVPIAHLRRVQAGP